MESTLTFSSYNIIKTNCSPATRFPNSKPTRTKILTPAKACSGSSNPVIWTLKTTSTAVIFAAAVFGRVSQLPAQACPPPTLTEEVAPQVEDQESSPFSKFLESNADAVTALSGLLQQKLEAGEDEEGLKILRKLSSAQPENVEWRLLMARLLNEMGNARDARAVFEDILLTNPLSFEALFENALLMDRCGEGEAVIRRLEEALKIAEEENKVKEARDVRLIMAQVQFLQKNVEGALGSYELLEKEDPKDFRPCFCKGMIYSLLDRNEEARAQFAKSRQLSPKPYEVEGYLRTPLSRMKLFGTGEDQNQQPGL